MISPLKERISVRSSILLSMHYEGDNVFNTTPEYKTRNNIESLIMLCNWFIETHESVGQERHFSNSDEESRDAEMTRSIMSKMNVIVSIISERAVTGDLVNVQVNSNGVKIDGDKEETRLCALEMNMHDSVAKKIILIAKQEKIGDDFIWIFQNLSVLERELFDKMVFLIDRNLVSSNH